MTKEQWLKKKAVCIQEGHCLRSKGLQSDSCVVRKTDCVSAGFAGKVTTPITDLYECCPEMCREEGEE